MPIFTRQRPPQRWSLTELTALASWAVVASFFTRLSGIVSAIALARVFTLDGFGRITLIQTSAAMLAGVTVASVSFSASKVAADAAVHAPDCFAAHLKPVVLTTFNRALAVGLFSALTIEVAASWFGDTQQLLSELRMATPLAFLLTLSTCHGIILTAAGRLRPLAGVGAVKAVLLAVLVPFGGYKGGVPGALAGLVATEVFASVATFRLIAGAFLMPGARDTSQQHFSVTGWTAPSLISGVSLQAALWLASIAVVRSAGIDQLALYGAAERWRQVILFVPSALSSLILPVLSRAGFGGVDAESRRLLRLQLTVTVVVTLIPATLLLIFGRHAVALFGDAFGPALQTVRILGASAVFVALNTSLGWVLIGRGLVWERAALDVMIASVLSISAFALGASGGVGLATASALAYAAPLPVMWLLIRSRRERQAATVLTDGSPL